MKYFVNLLNIIKLLEIYLSCMVNLMKGFLLLFLINIAVFVNGQPTMTNNNAVVYHNVGSVTWINGSLQNFGDSIHNLGRIYVSGDDKPSNQGDLINKGVISGNGKYFVAGHWINDSVFKCGTSEVFMDNTPGGIPSIVNNQYIKGSKITTFYDLTLRGVGIKFMTQNDTVKHLLNLNDRELAVDSNTVFVTNTNPAAITRTYGFISNLWDGGLNRYTGVVGAYLFPMGSSGGPYAGPYRYRPVDIRPIKNTPSQYKVGYYNYVATLDGFNIDSVDNTFCKVNPLFYHRINRVAGLDTVDLISYYDAVTDGYWDGQGNWNLNNLNQWTNMGNTSLVYNPMRGVKKTKWATWKDLPYALIAQIPDSVTITGVDEICIGTGITSFNVNGNAGSSYIWTVTGGHIVGDSTGNKIDVIFDTPGLGIVTVQEVINWSKCESHTAHFYIPVYPQTIANFEVIPEDSTHIFSYDLVHFVDHSSNADQWHWDFGDNLVSDQQSPFHMYTNPGQYKVCLSVESDYHCFDDTCIVINVLEGIEDIPNIITPGNDGFNDLFNINTSGLTEFNLQIFNRWGALIFESNSPYVKWDGKTLAGELVTDGTYFYILRAKSDIQVYDRNGFITVLSNK